MKRTVLFLVLCLITHMSTLDIPKSSLETIKTHIQKQLDDAQTAGEKTLVIKFQKELDDVQKKIKKFEIEWLEYKKEQLGNKSGSVTNKNLLDEINKLLVQLKGAQ